MCCQALLSNTSRRLFLPLQVCCECGCDEAVFPLSVSLMDRFLSASLSLPVSPYCLAAGCILIASKLTESDNVTADTLCAAAEYSFLPSDLRVSHSIHRHVGEKFTYNQGCSGVEEGVVSSCGPLTPTNP